MTSTFRNGITSNRLVKFQEILHKHAQRKLSKNVLLQNIDLIKDLFYKKN